MRFAGYRVYKLADWRGRTSELSRREKWSLWNAFGDEGRDGRLPLDSIRDTTLDYQLILYEQKLYEPGRYAVVDTEALNGFEYAYAVTAVFEQERDVGNGVLIESTESPFIPSANQMIQPHAASRDQAGEVWVVPNPFRARADWDLPPILGQQLTRHLDFMGLPRAPSTIRIYTLAGDHVATIQHDGSYGDGQASWNLVSRNGQEVVSGIYVFTVDSTLGHQVGRFVVIR
jgi:hypothetical protein